MNLNSCLIHWRRMHWHITSNRCYLGFRSEEREDQSMASMPSSSRNCRHTLVSRVCRHCPAPGGTHCTRRNPLHQEEPRAHCTRRNPLHQEEHRAHCTRRNTGPTAPGGTQGPLHQEEPRAHCTRRNPLHQEEHRAHCTRRNPLHTWFSPVAYVHL